MPDHPGWLQWSSSSWPGQCPRSGGTPGWGSPWCHRRRSRWSSRPGCWTSTSTTPTMTVMPTWSRPSAAAWTSSTSAPGWTSRSRSGSSNPGRSFRRLGTAGRPPRRWWARARGGGARPGSVDPGGTGAAGCSRPRPGGCPPCWSCSSGEGCDDAVLKTRHWPAQEKQKLSQ